VIIKLWEIEDQGHSRKFLQRQFRDLFSKAFNYFKLEVESDGPVRGVAISQDRIVDGCDVGPVTLERKVWVSQHAATHRPSCMDTAVVIYIIEYFLLC
jgi:hypothetical protein